MKLGILGSPGAGKSTLFDILTESYEGPDAFQAPNKPRVKVVKVEDARLDRLRQDFESRKCTPATIEIVDFPAVAREGERTKLADLLAPAREMDVFFVVMRGFGASGLSAPAPRTDLAEIHAELLLSDLVLVERRLERLKEKSRKPQFTADDRKEQELLERLEEHLNAERPLATLELTADEEKRLSGFGFVSSKPQVVVLNVSDLQDADRLRADLDAIEDGPEVFVVSGRNELEILQLEPGERQVFLEEYGITELSRAALISSAYRAAGRISFFTARAKEARAWTIRRGQTALEAAAEVHTDMARGFIRAEVVSFDDYVLYGGVRGAREKGRLRLEGKDYTVADGDVIEFRFSV